MPPRVGCEDRSEGGCGCGTARYVSDLQSSNGQQLIGPIQVQPLRRKQPTFQSTMLPLCGPSLLRNDSGPEAAASGPEPARASPRRCRAAARCAFRDAMLLAQSPRRLHVALRRRPAGGRRACKLVFMCYEILVRPRSSSSL